MGVDLSKIAKAQQTCKVNLDLKEPGAMSLDRVTLRKSWGKNASYWIDIIRNPQGLMQVIRSWQWMRDGEIIEGNSRSGNPTIKNSIVSDNYFRIISAQVTDKNYVIDGRQSSTNSPISAPEWDSFVQGLDLPVKEVYPRKKNILPKRKAEKDWW